MPRAEVGSVKHLANKMKSKGLQRLRWYCQPCEKQCRDENGYKCHVMSETHMRNMQSVTEDSRKFLADYSKQFQRDFLQLLRTAHGEKPVHVNHFYQEYIRDKEHVHMNATNWSSLTEFSKHLGRNGICRVTEEEKGLYIAWIDNSPEALKRREYSKKKEAEKWGDEQFERRLLADQQKRARQAAIDEGPKEEEPKEEEATFERKEGDTIKFSLGPKPVAATDAGVETPAEKGDSPPETADTDKASPSADSPADTPLAATEPKPAAPVKISFGIAQPAAKPINAFAAERKAANAFAKQKKKDKATEGSAAPGPVKKMSNAERIMKEEIERNKRKLGGSGTGPAKKMRIAL